MRGKWRFSLERFALLTLMVTVVVAAALVMIVRRPALETVQRGYRGTGMEELYDGHVLAALADANRLPDILPSLGTGGPTASAVYKNVQVLKDVPVTEFTRLMVSLTSWVAPKQGCNYCHNPNDLASDALYTKVVARRMIQMVQHINGNWKTHVAATGVTCYTCHRGEPVPVNIWFNTPGPQQANGMAQVPAGKNHPSVVAGLTALPYTALTDFLDQANDIRVVGTTALPTGNRHSIKQTEWTYALMMNFSEALGVNCTFCHSTRSFTDWEQSTPQRETAWYGIRMVRDLNTAYLDPLAHVFPPARLGPAGDGPKVSCATCHNGVYKPLFGASMLTQFPELAGAGSNP